MVNNKNKMNPVRSPRHENLSLNFHAHNNGIINRSLKKLKSRGNNELKQTSNGMNNSATEFLKSYDALADALFRHCYFRVYERERAKELVQETFMRTWEYIAKGNEVKNIRAFLYRVANNLVIDESRKTKPVSLDVLRESGFDIATPSPAEAIATGIDAEKVLAKIAKLDAPYKEVLIMRYVDGFGPKEIAKITGESENVISVRLHRATKHITTLIHNEQQA